LALFSFFFCIYDGTALYNPKDSLRDAAEADKFKESAASQWNVIQKILSSLPANFFSEVRHVTAFFFYFVFCTAPCDSLQNASHSSTTLACIRLLRHVKGGFVGLAGPLLVAVAAYSSSVPWTTARTKEITAGILLPGHLDPSIILLCLKLLQMSSLP
jgi:hypothetical protein